MSITTEDPNYLATAAMMPMLRLQGLTLSALVERKVISSSEAKALVKEAKQAIDVLRVSDPLKADLHSLYDQLAAQF